MPSAALVLSGSESLAFLTSQDAQYTGGDTRLGRRIRLGVTVALFALVLRAVVDAVTHGGPPSKRRNAIQDDPSKVGRIVQDNFDVYDVVIVGGGTAGCVLASRLSERPDVRVLLLEAGGSVMKHRLVRTPVGYSFLLRTPMVFDLHTTPQQGSGGRQHYWPRAKILGGCSSINAQVVHYGDPADYDEWARLGGDGAESWGYQSFHKYFLKLEKFIPSAMHPEVIADEHGANGPVEIGFHAYYSAITQRFVQACNRVGIPLRADLNTSRGTLGVARVGVTYINSSGRRVTTESAYLTPTVLSRPNLTVAVNASATRVIFDISGLRPRAVGVEFAAFKDGPRFRVRANKEIVLSAGAIHSPHILMLSGVGPASHLAEHNIPVIASVPGVGEHLMDHVVVDVTLAETCGTSLSYLKPESLWQCIKYIYSLLNYTFTGKGPFTTNVAEAAAFFRSTDPVLFPLQMTAALPAPSEDSTSGPHAPDLELLVSPMGYGKTARLTPSRDTLGLHMALLRPTSKGNLRLNSSDPFEHPLIDPKYLSTEHDIAVLERGMNIVTRLMHTAPLADIIDHTAVGTCLDHQLPTAQLAEVRTYMRSYLETLYHPTSTARMAPLADGGVVDARLRVHGVQALRVVDASIFPTIISGHTAGPTIAVAEKAADLILEDMSQPD